MLTASFQSIVTASRQFFRNWRAMLVLTTLYASLLATLYSLVTIREATAGQVVLTSVCIILAPLLFFLLQTASALQSRHPGAGPLLKQSFQDFWKVIVISLPLIALAVVAAYLLGKAQAHFGVPGEGLSQLGEPHSFRSENAQGKPPLQWIVVILTTLRYLLIGLLVPVAMIHLWIATVREGLILTIKGIRSRIFRAFVPQSVLIYMAGFLVFGVIPYLIVFQTMRVGNASLELTLFVGRLCAAFALTLFGWAMTIGALAISSKDSLQEFSTEDL